MGIFGAVLLFAALIVFYVLIADVFTVIFRLTGLSEEKARFQVVSLLTNSGYTTRESELIAESKTRCRLARFIMIFGYAFTVTIVSSVVNIFLAFKLTDFENILSALPWPITIVLLIVALVLFRKNAPLRRRFDRYIERVADRKMFRRDENRLMLLDEYGALVVAQVNAAVMPEPLRDRSVAASGLRSRNILIMLRKRGEKDAERVVGDTVLKNGDVLVVFGPLHEIRDAFAIKDA